MIKDMHSEPFCWSKGRNSLAQMLRDPFAGPRKGPQTQQHYQISTALGYFTAEPTRPDGRAPDFSHGVTMLSLRLSVT